MEYKSFLLGLAAITLLIQLTYLIREIAIRYKELFLIIAYGMLVVDGLALASYIFLMKPLSNNPESFTAGIGLAIFTAMIHKITVFLKSIPT